MIVDAVYTGGVRPLAGDSRASASVRAAGAGAVALGPQGLEGDAHGDPKAHGGTEKALHLYPADHYARLAAAFPDAAHLTPGGLGENISVRGIDEAGVCLGDRHAIGTAVVEVSQPRSPCWKIDHRCGVEGIANFVALHGLTGWYYRVIVPGEIAAGMTLELVARPAGAVSLADYWRATQAHRPDPDWLERIAAAIGLAADKRRKLLDRAAWLHANTTPEP